MIDGLIESIRFGFSSLGSPLSPVSNSAINEQKKQDGIPAGGIRFGFRPRGNAGSGVSLGPVQPQYQSGLPPAAIRFGVKPLGNPPTAPGTGNGVPHFQSGLPPQLIRFGFQPQGSATPIPASPRPEPRPEVVNNLAGSLAPLHRRKKNVIEYPVRDSDLREELPPEPQPEPSAEPRAPEKPKPRLEAVGPMPLLANFGKGPVAIGLKLPSLNEQMEESIQADDEEAIIAILLAALK